jgi:hypothetical protein
MTFNIDTFKSSGLIFGGARPTLFEVECTFPSAITVPQDIKGGKFLIQSSSLPAMLQDEVRVPYFGRTIKLQGDRTFQDWKVTVLNDEDFVLRDTFENWQNMMNTLISNRLDAEVSSLAGPNSYKQDMLVRQYAKTGPGTSSGVIRQYKIVGAFPNTIDAIPVDWANVNRVEQFDVTFSYDYWIPWEGNTERYGPVLSPE